MPIINSLGALHYPKIKLESDFGNGVGYTALTTSPITVYNKDNRQGAPLDPNFSSVGADSSGNMYFQGCTIPTDTLLSNGTAYPIQIDDLDATPQFDFSQTGIQGFGAITTTTNYSIFPQENYVSGSGGTSIWNNRAGTVGGLDIDINTGTINGSRVYYQAGKANNNDMYVLGYTQTTNQATNFHAYGGGGADNGSITSTIFGDLLAKKGRACTNDAGVTIVSCLNTVDNVYYIGRPIQVIGGINWDFQTTHEIYDIDCDDDYVYVSHSGANAVSIPHVSKLDITNGTVVSTYIYGNYGAGRYIKVADDGYVYLANSSFGKLDKNLNMQWGNSIQFIYTLSTLGVIGFQGFTVRDDYIYAIGVIDDRICAVKFPTDGEIINPGTWWFAGGLLKMQKLSTPSRTAATFTLSAITRNIVFRPTIPFTPTFAGSMATSSTGIITNNQAI